MFRHAFQRDSSFNHTPSSLREFIRYQGPISVEKAQELALYHHEYGYYLNASTIGNGGDFITAPEVSQLFGDMLGLWCIAQWQQAGSPLSIHIIELGPGNGTLMQDILSITNQKKDFIDSLTVSLVEICPALTIKQKTALQRYDYVYWYKHLEEVPKGADFTIIIANEFFDCLPIKQFVGEEERYITYNEQYHDLIFSPAGNPKTIKETCPIATGLSREITRHLSPGVGLIIDYGDSTTPETRLGDTLQAVYKHQPVDVLQSLGFADLSHQVDFFHLQSLFESSRFQTQGDFLLTLGVEHRMAKLMKVANPEQQFQLTTGASRLVAPSEMGQKFKVLEIFNL